MNKPISLTSIFLLLTFLDEWRGLFLNRFFLIFLLQRYILHSFADLNILFHRCRLHYSCFRQLIPDTLDCLCNLSMEPCCSRYSSRQQIVCITNIFGLNCPRHIFFLQVRLYISVKLLNFTVISIQSNCLFEPKKSIVTESKPNTISYVFWMGVFCTPILNIFLGRLCKNYFCIWQSNFLLPFILILTVFSCQFQGDTLF